ncbi:HAD-IIIA family hydrolase [Flaviaesturariibacter amylovorans]|uniref:Nucleotidyl transferase domain-containing protein n=1 Tax=Flaviaesturariibacter amylovorans TaxID=1084520 RepID=A0ABP8GSJ3_9BACT
MIQITEAVVLAGGLGTRLRSAVPDLPKCMAPVAGRPFLGYVIDSLRREGVQRFIFSLGYMYEAIEAWLSEAYPTLDYVSVIEAEPLGTGGGIQLALRAAVSEQVLVANGDTLFEVSVADLAEVHARTGAECTLALKPMTDFDRYGVVRIDGAGTVMAFEEKKQYAEGLINGGLYLVNRASLLALGLPEKFSFEKEYLEPSVARRALAGAVQEGYFIDIGLPGDYSRAQTELQPKTLDLAAVDNSWTLFLDRDGVINDEIVGTYVLSWEGFRFSTGVLEAMPLLASSFGRIVLVSNQRGVGRGLMSAADLDRIHTEMRSSIEAVGGRLDAVYFCTEKEERCFFRKPNPGMAVQARAQFPDIDPKKSIMVGNKPSDMRFGRAAGLYTVFVTTTNPGQPFPHPDIDRIYPTLLDFTRDLERAKER